MVFQKNMFDIGWSELLIIGVMALIVVGPKELPGLLRTLGRYVGVIRRQAMEFRQQFDDVLRDTEIDQIRQDMAGIKSDVTSTMHDATKQVERELEAGKVDLSAKETLENKTAASEAADFEKDASDLLDDPMDEPVTKPESVDSAASAETPVRVESNAEKSEA